MFTTVRPARSGMHGRTLPGPYRQAPCPARAPVRPARSAPALAPVGALPPAQPWPALAQPVPATCTDGEPYRWTAVQVASRTGGPPYLACRSGGQPYRWTAVLGSPLRWTAVQKTGRTGGGPNMTCVRGPWRPMGKRKTGRSPFHHAACSSRSRCCQATSFSRNLRPVVSHQCSRSSWYVMWACS